MKPGRISITCCESNAMMKNNEPDIEENIRELQSKKRSTSSEKYQKSRAKPLHISTRGKTDHLFRKIDNASYIIFDIETTGGNPERNGITEIFAVRYSKGREEDSFYSMVNPKVSIPPIVRKMTGITNKMVKDAPLISEVMPNFVEFIRDDILVSHNTIGDMKFLRHFSKETTGKMIHNYFLCTHLLAEKLAPKAPNKSLQGLCQYYKILEKSKIHRAREDAYMTLGLFQVYQKMLLSRQITTVADAIRFQGDYESGTRLGWGVSKENLRSLPEKPGVYFLHDKNDEIKFVSSAKNIAREVHKLQNVSSLPRGLLKHVLGTYRITYEITADFFSAMMAESKAVSANQLVFDPIAWHQRSAHFLYLAKNSKGMRLATGPLEEGVIFALGPLRGDRETSFFINKISEFFAGKNIKRGFEIPSSEGRMLLDFLDRGTVKNSFCFRTIINIFRDKNQKERERTLRDELNKLKIPFALKQLRLFSGLLASHEAEKWHFYYIISGRFYHVSTMEGKVGDNIFDKLPPMTAEKIERKQIRKNVSYLSRREAEEINRVVWCSTINTSSHRKFFSLEELVSHGKMDSSCTLETDDIEDMPT
ncbi:MAG: hypothetical protein HQK54_11955 [Oligoflexales bacterium]|nr:hypothetical protein [Oligoflexales bacterium]